MVQTLISTVFLSNLELSLRLGHSRKGSVLLVPLL